MVESRLEGDNDMNTNRLHVLGGQIKVISISSVVVCAFEAVRLIHCQYCAYMVRPALSG